MNNKRIVITGIGIISPNGMGKDAFWQALEEGRSGIKPMTIIDTTYFKTKLAGECTDFKAEDFLGHKGLRGLNRSSKLVCSSAKFALEDANLKITEDNTDDAGVVTATTFSISWDIAEFTQEGVKDGPQFINPALFPPTTMNFPSSQISIWHKIKGFNTTISTGYTAGLDAVKYAIDFIRAGRAKAVLVSGVESLTFSNFIGFYKTGFLAGLKGVELSCPFDNRHNGIIFSEGAGSLIIEEEEFALRRGARIYAEILSVESMFSAFHTTKYEPRVAGLKDTMLNALKEAHLAEEEIDYICASANSVPSQDILETKAIKEVFNVYAKKIPTSSIKSMIGESISAAGIFQAAAAVGAITKGFIPPTINFQMPEKYCELDYVPNTAKKQHTRNVLINNFGPGGNNSTAIISQYNLKK